jgi:acetylornithine/succinyldiaminopimelate/putrescine aminotransferase
MNLDVLAPEPEFMEGMQKLCRKYGTLIIMDEVACGFGRTGKLFATEYFDIRPDIMCLGKALSGGHAAIGATLMTREIGETLAEEEYPYSTFGWHPLSVAASLAAVKFYRDNWDELDENIRSLNEYFRQRLSEMKFKVNPEIRIMGMAMQLDFKKSDYGDKVEERALRKGLVLAGGVTMLPPLTLDLKTARKGLDILEECL